jgi:hypothetical protein
MGKYIDSSVVKSFLETKVSFGPDDSQISDIELNMLISQAESKVQLELSNQYIIPFQGYEGRTFHEIVYDETREIISNLCLYRSLYNVCKYYFGKVSNNRGQSYIDFYDDLFKETIEPLKRKRSTGAFDTPPLAGLLLNGNSQRVSPVLPSPQVATCGVSSFGYANTHVNNPQFGLPGYGYYSNGIWVCAKR